MKKLVVAITIALGLTFAVGAANVAVAAGGDKSEAHAGAHHGPPPITWTGFGDKAEHIPPGFIFMLLNFAILLFILGKFGGGALSKYADKRHEEVKKALEEGARLRKEAEEMVAEYSKRISGVDAEIDELISGARSDAEKEKARIIEAAEAQAEALQKDAENRIAAEIAAARHKLETEVIAAAIAAAEEILAKKTTSADQTKLVDNFIATLGDENKQQELS